MTHELEEREVLLSISCRCQRLDLRATQQVAKREPIGIKDRRRCDRSRRSAHLSYTSTRDESQLVKINLIHESLDLI